MGVLVDEVLLDAVPAKTVAVREVPEEPLGMEVVDPVLAPLPLLPPLALAGAVMVAAPLWEGVFEEPGE